MADETPSKWNAGKILSMPLTVWDDGYFMKKKSSNEIVEELKSKGIHAEVCKRHKK